MSKRGAQLNKTKLQGYTDNQIKRINEFRELQGLRPLTTKIRSCLKCSKEFESIDVGNRVCDSCNQYPGRHHDWGSVAHVNVR